MIEDAPVRTESEAVGDEEPADHRRAPLVGGEAVQRALRPRRIDRIFHAADPKATLAVAAPVIQAVIGEISFRVGERRALLRGKVIAPQPGLERQEDRTVVHNAKEPMGSGSVQTRLRPVEGSKRLSRPAGMSIQ